MAQIYLKQSRDLQTLGAFDVTAQRPGLAREVARYAAAAALAELALRLSPSEPHPEIFDLLAAALDRLDQAESDDVPVLSIAALWRMIGTLGFSPSLDACARDGRPLPDGTARFSVMDGGFLCASCAAASDAPKLPVEDRAALKQLVAGDLPGDLSDKRLAAHRRLFTRFVRRHASEDKELDALAFWEEQS